MAAYIQNSKKGFTISFQTRGVDMETANKIWNYLTPDKIKELTDYTGYNLIVWNENLCAEIHKTDWGNYTIWCGKVFDKEQDYDI